MVRGAHREICAVLVAEAVFFGKRATRKVVAAIVLVCVGVGLSTVTDTQMGSNMAGWLVGLGAIGATAAYQIWAGVFPYTKRSTLLSEALPGR